MDKKDWIWVAIRIFGIYMLVLAVTGVPSLISSAWMTHAFWSLEKRRGPTLSEDDSNKVLLDALLRAKGIYASSLLAQVVRVIVFTLIGVYLLKSGRLIFRLIHPPDRPSTPLTQGE